MLGHRVKVTYHTSQHRTTDHSPGIPTCINAELDCTALPVDSRQLKTHSLSDVQWRVDVSVGCSRRSCADLSQCTHGTMLSMVHSPWGVKVLTISGWRCVVCCRVCDGGRC